MIVLETSALLAMLLNEPTRPALQARLTLDEDVIIGAPSVLEATMVLSSRRGLDASEEVNEFLSVLRASVVPFTERHAATAQIAFSRFGKGNNPAKLNLGDCMAYAIAKVANEPLLFVGNDFTQTDILKA